MRLQDLEPAAAKLCLKIESVCRNKLPIRPGDRLLLAVSGGADSLALTLILHILAPRLQIGLSAMHINHMLRPTADAEAEFTVKFCAGLNLPCAIARAEIGKIAESSGLGLEEAGRNARRALLAREAERAGARYILLGHHQSDLAEDILMRLTRGSGWPALGGMSCQNGMFLRPLLHTDPQKLREFLIVCGCQWQEDESNESLKFTRNRFRHVILPLLRCENPAITDTLARLHAQAEIDEDYWTTLLDNALQRQPWQIQIDKDNASLLLPAGLLLELHPAARMRLYHRALKYLRELTATQGQVRADMLTRLDRAWQSRIGNKKLQCGNGIDAICSRAGITFCGPAGAAITSSQPQGQNNASP